MARESTDLRVLERRDQRLNSRVRSQPSRDERTEEVNNVKEVLVPPASHESTHQTLDTGIVLRHASSLRVETLTGL